MFYFDPRLRKVQINWANCLFKSGFKDHITLDQDQDTSGSLTFSTKFIGTEFVFQVEGYNESAQPGHIHRVTKRANQRAFGSLYLGTSAPKNVLRRRFNFFISLFFCPLNLTFSLFAYAW